MRPDQETNQSFIRPYSFIRLFNNVKKLKNWIRKSIGRDGCADVTFDKSLHVFFGIAIPKYR